MMGTQKKHNVAPLHILLLFEEKNIIRYYHNYLYVDKQETNIKWSTHNVKDTVSCFNYFETKYLKRPTLKPELCKYQT
jgi:hypothetical protein